MRFKRCFNCGNIVLKKRKTSKYCSPECEEENRDKSLQTNDKWENKLINLDIASKEKSKDERIMRR